MVGAVGLGLVLSCTPSTPTYTVKYVEKRASLDNGIRMVVLPDTTTPMVHVAVRYEVGSNEDPDGKAGLAHLVEHMMFQHRFLGPDKPPTFQILPQIATGFNAWTNFDTTHYYLEGRKEDMEAMLRIEAARMNAICDTIPPEQFEREREVVRNEIRQRGGTPDGLIPQMILDAVYPPGHAYNQSVGGNDAQLSNITFDDVCEFLTDYYTPSRATVVVAGNVDVDEVGERVAFYFGGIASREPKPRKAVADLAEFKHTIIKKDVNVERSTLLIMWRLPSQASDEWPAAQTMMGVLNSRLAFFNQDWDFAASVGAFPYGGELAPVLVLAVELYDADDAGEALGYVWKATNGLHRSFEEGVFATETKAVAKADMITSLESLAARATFVADRVQFQKAVDFSGSGEYLFHELEQIDKLSGGQFRSFMKGTIKKSNAIVLQINSSKKGLKGDKRSGLKYTANTHSSDQVPLIDPTEAQRPLPAPETDSILKDAVRYTLGNGMKVVLLPREGMPIVSTRLMFNTGSAHEDPAKAGLAGVSAAYLWPPRDSTFTRVGVSFRGSAGQDHTSFRSHGMNIYLEVAIKGLERLIKVSEHSQGAIESWQKFQRLQRKSERFRRNEAFQMEIAKAIYGPDHPYATTGSPTDDSIGRIGRDVAMSFKNKHYSAQDATFIVVGDFDLEEAKALISSNFGAWGKGSHTEAIAASAKTRTGPEYFGVIEPDEGPQMQVSIVYPGPAGMDENEAARSILTTMLNLRLAQIRTELGSTYGTYAGRRASIGPSAYFMGGGVDAERAGESLAAMREKIDGLRRGEDFDMDFATARRMVLKRLLAESTDTGSIASRLSTIAAYDLPPDYFDQQVRRVAAVSPDDVKALMAKELKPELEVVGCMADRETLEKAFSEAGLDTVKFIEPQ
jgi:zinc protease